MMVPKARRPSRHCMGVGLGLGLGALGLHPLSPPMGWAAPPPLTPPAPVLPATRPPAPAAAAPSRAAAAPSPAQPGPALLVLYQKVTCKAAEMKKEDCSEQQVQELLRRYEQPGLDAEQQRLADSDQLTCLEEYYQRTRCAHAACFLAEGLNAKAIRDAKSDSVQTAGLADVARAYGTACLSCAPQTAESELPRRAVAEFQPPSEPLPSRTQKILGATLLGVGAASLAAGFSMLPLNGQLSETPDCTSAGQPVRCVTQLDTPIALTLTLGAAATVAGITWLSLGCTACSRWQLPKPVLYTAPQGGPR